MRAGNGSTAEDFPLPASSWGGRAPASSASLPHRFQGAADQPHPERRGLGGDRDAGPRDLLDASASRLRRLRGRLRWGLFASWARRRRWRLWRRTRPRLRGLGGRRLGLGSLGAPGLRLRRLALFAPRAADARAFAREVPEDAAVARGGRWVLSVFGHVDMFADEGA